MEKAKSLVVDKIKEIFYETFYKVEDKKLNSTIGKNETRDYNATTMDRVITSLGLSIMVYICLIIGAIGSYAYKMKQKNVKFMRENKII